MPYRRLPNTDGARIEALDALIQKAGSVSEAARPYPAPLHTDVEALVSPSVRAYYGLDISSSAVPRLRADAEVTYWAGKVVQGEAARLAGEASAVPLAWPSAAEVQAAADRYAESAAARTVAKDAYDSAQEAVAALRPRADRLIREIWDHIEFAHRADSAPSRRRKCREWGIVYVSRRGEREDSSPPDLSGGS